MEFISAIEGPDETRKAHAMTRADLEDLKARAFETQRKIALREAKT